MTREKLNAFKKTQKKFFFLDNVENAKMTKIYKKKTYFFGFSLFFSFFGFFENISKTWVKNWVATIMLVDLRRRNMKAGKIVGRKIGRCKSGGMMSSTWMG